MYRNDGLITDYGGLFCCHDLREISGRMEIWRWGKGNCRTQGTESKNNKINFYKSVCGFINCFVSKYTDILIKINKKLVPSIS